MGAPKRRTASADSGHGRKGQGSALAAAALAVLSSPALNDAPGSKRWPLLCATLALTRDVNGDDCEPGGVSITAKSGRISWSLRSPAYNVRISGWTDSLTDVLDAIEAVLGSANPACVELKKHVGKKYRDRLNKGLTNNPS